MSKQLLSCPFCASEDVSVSTSYFIDKRIAGYSVECSSCAAFGPEKETEEQAINSWNGQLYSIKQNKLCGCTNSCITTIYICKDCGGLVRK